METRIKLTIDDTLSFYNDFIGDYVFNDNNIQTNDYFLRVPPVWLENGQLNSNALERFYDFLYGSNWRAGNGDGSRYLPLKAAITLLNDLQKDEWLTKRNCYVANLDGTFGEISSQEF